MTQLLMRSLSPEVINKHCIDIIGLINDLWLALVIISVTLTVPPQCCEMMEIETYYHVSLRVSVSKELIVKYSN